MRRACFFFSVAAAVLGVLGLTGPNGQVAAAPHGPLASQSAPVPVFVFTSSTDPSVEEYVIDEFKKELPKRAKDFPYTLVDSREQARVVVEIDQISDFCTLTTGMVGIVATLKVGSFSDRIAAGAACSPYKRYKYRPLGKKLAEALSKWGKEHRTYLSTPPVAGLFVGRHGYKIEIPAEYRASALPSKGDVEVVFIAPSGIDVTVDESHYAASRIVRLEAWKKAKVTLADWKKRVSVSLDRAKEAYTISDVDVGSPGFLVHITAPKEIRQLFVEGPTIMFMLTGADEEQLLLLARAIK